ncbi:hypothetical protein BigBertha_232 [Bacillus phage BigBertha]|nr:hypothetical protein BigBertha_232 [Bacillus phage BigBertha]AGY46740.1 hypothetical protein BigBertha_232 [Bacillus phage BigBertha]AMW61611.1 hypothetical protein JUGLONE_235 [Bacillus phage Juglone]QDH49930.1 hypothetical protein BEYONPHE_243 [Bacillus phage Beyonphe]QPY77463.1 membrane protein [Bacillus phage Anthos]
MLKLNKTEKFTVVGLIIGLSLMISGLGWVMLEFAKYVGGIN